MLTNVDKTVELFNEALDKTGNSYLYFELAYTNYTGWMCWLQDRTGGEKCKKNLCPPGQADEPGVACVPVKQYLEAWKRNGWTPRNVPPLEANKEHPFDGKWVIPKQLDDIIKAQADAEALKKVEAIIGDLDKTNGHRPECVCQECATCKAKSQMEASISQKDDIQKDLDTKAKSGIPIR